MSPTGRDRYTEDRPPGAELPAEAELIDRFWSRVCVMAAHRLRDPGAAQDVAQETMRRVIAAMRERRIENPAALPAFVFQTARHICLHAYRSEGREERALARFGAEGETADDIPNALVSLISAEDRMAVRGALAQLHDAERALLTMLYFDGVETDRAADSLHITQGALRVRKHRALARLAELMGREISVKRSPHIGDVQP
jgi:RNA polymerase sigma-70 factor (ECF subfamily)